LNEFGLLEWKTGRFPARMSCARIKRNRVKPEPGRIKRITPESATFPDAEKKNADSTRLRGAPTAPPSSPIWDPLQISGGIMNRKIAI